MSKIRVVQIAMVGDVDGIYTEYLDTDGQVWSNYNGEFKLVELPERPEIDIKDMKPDQDLISYCP